MATQDKTLRVGMVGSGDVAQIIHLPTIMLMNHLFQVTIVCDLSPKNAEHCAKKFHVPAWTTDPTKVFTSPNVDIVFVLTSDEWHEPYIIAALEAGKHVMAEKPLTLSIPSCQRIIEAEKKANGPRIFVGYMRRYATSYTQTFLREIGTIPKILYARSRDFSGPNLKFVTESGAFQVRNTDFPAGSSEERDRRFDAFFHEAFPNVKEITQAHKDYCFYMGRLGSHDISLLRDALGTPESISGVSVNEPFYSAIFNYRNKTGEPFSVTYESGIDDVPVFDAHLAVYGEKKRVTIAYDSPFVKGLAIKVTVQELNEHGEIQSKEMLGSYEDAYTTELKELYECIVNGKDIRTSASDVLEDLKIYDQMYAVWEKARMTLA